MRRAGLLIALVVLGGAVLAACGGDDSSSSSSSTSSTSASTSTSAARPRPPRRPPPCPGRRRARRARSPREISPPDAGAGQRNSVLVFTNNGAGPCTMNGYVGLQLQSQDGQAIPTNVVRGQGAGGARDAPVRRSGVHDAAVGRHPERQRGPERSVRGRPRGDRDHVTRTRRSRWCSRGATAPYAGRARSTRCRSRPAAARPNPELTSSVAVGGAGASARVGCGAAWRHATRRT